MIVLIALRHWAGRWELQRFRIKGKSDNVAALVAIGPLKASTTSGHLIARELAMDYGRALYRPSVVTHTPGRANFVPG